MLACSDTETFERFYEILDDCFGYQKFALKFDLLDLENKGLKSGKFITQYRKSALNNGFQSRSFRKDLTVIIVFYKLGTTEIEILNMANALVSESVDQCIFCLV